MKHYTAVFKGVGIDSQSIEINQRADGSVYVSFQRTDEGHVSLEITDLLEIVNHALEMQNAATRS